MPMCLLCLCFVVALVMLCLFVVIGCVVECCFGGMGGGIAVCALFAYMLNYNMVWQVHEFRT